MGGQLFQIQILEWTLSCYKDSLMAYWKHFYGFTMLDSFNFTLMVSKLHRNISDHIITLDMKPTHDLVAPSNQF